MFDAIVSGNFLNGFEVPKKANEVYTLGSKIIILFNSKQATRNNDWNISE